MRKTITKQEIEKLRSEGVPVKMVDIRTPEEFQNQHIPNVINIPFESLPEETQDYSKDKTIVCICNHGKERSQKAAETLFNSGFNNTYFLEGGTSGWLNNSL